VETVGQQTFEFLSQYGYWIMLPLMIVEGPAATLVAAVLASLGAFNIWVVFILSVIGDIIGDIVLYGFGHYSNVPFIHKFKDRIGITEVRIQKIEEKFNQSGEKIIFFVKATTGLKAITFVAAGVARMQFKKFVIYTTLGGIVWSGLLSALGYLYGYLWQEIAQYIKWVGILIATIIVLTILIVYIRNKRSAI